MKIQIKLDPIGAQREFFEDDTTKFLHLSGGFGCGKTHILCHKLFKLSFLNRPIHGGLVCPSYADFKRDVLLEIEGILDRDGISFFYHKTDHFFVFPWSAGRLYVATAEKAIRGPNWGYCGINELTLIPLVRYREAIGRVRKKGAKFPQIASVGTPEGLASEYHEIFVNKPWPNSKCLYGDTRDNLKNLDPAYISALENSYDSKMLDAYMRGMWVNLAGNRFYYSYDPNKNDDTSVTFDAAQHVHAFMDFNVKYMTATFWHFDGGSLSAFDEIVIDDNADTSKMCQAMYSRGYRPSNTTIYPDPAGRARKTTGMPDITVIEHAGYSDIQVRNIHPPIRARQLNANNLLEKRLIKINPNKCPTLKRDLLSVQQDTANFEKVKANEALTHASDGMDYGIDFLFPFSGKKPDSKVVRFR